MSNEIRCAAVSSVATKFAPSPAERLELHQALFERLLAKAEAGRRREFVRALEQGMTLDEIAEAVCLEVGEVEDIVRETG